MRYHYNTIQPRIQGPNMINADISVPPLKIQNDHDKHYKHRLLPLVIDVDGTLIEGDITRTAILKYGRTYFSGSLCNWVKAPFALAWLLSSILLGAFLFLLLPSWMIFFTVITPESKIYTSIISFLLSWKNWIIGDIVIFTILSLLMMKHTFLFFKFPLPHTRAKFKKDLAQKITLTNQDWKFIPEMLSLVKKECRKNRPLLLATGMDKKYAQLIAIALQKELGRTGKIEFLSSDGADNFISSTKEMALIERYGKKGFIYAGNSNADIPVWKSCAYPIIVIKRSWRPLATKLLDSSHDIYVVSQNKPSIWHKIKTKLSKHTGLKAQKKQPVTSLQNTYTYKEHSKKSTLRKMGNHLHYFYVRYIPFDDTAQATGSAPSKIFSEGAKNFYESMWDKLAPTYYLKENYGMRCLFLSRDLLLFTLIISIVLLAYHISPMQEDTLEILNIYENDSTPDNYWNLFKVIPRLFLLIFLFSLATFFIGDTLRSFFSLCFKKFSSPYYILSEKRKDIEDFIVNFTIFFPIALIILINLYMMVSFNSLQSFLIMTFNFFSFIALTLVTLDKKHPTNFYLSLLSTFFFAISLRDFIKSILPDLHGSWV